MFLERIGGKTVVLPASKDELPNCIVITNVPDEVCPSLSSFLVVL